MDKISIIVPVYNVEQYIGRCIESLISQTYHDLEIILIDDGATDNSGLLCDEWADKDKRIKVIHKANGGISEARNYGIDVATGDYICFVDSDDYVATDYCQRMLEVAIREKADIVICKYIRFSGELCTKETENGKNEHSFNAIRALELIYSAEGEMYTVAWNKLYKRNVIGDIRFPKGKVNEDEYTTYKFFMNSSKIVTIDDVLYYYFRNSNSITTNKNYMGNTDIFGALEERKKLFSRMVDSEKNTLIGLTDKNYLDRIIIRNKYLIDMDSIRSKEFIDRYRMYYRHQNVKVEGIGYKIYYISPKLYYLLLDVISKIKKAK